MPFLVLWISENAKNSHGHFPDHPLSSKIWGEEKHGILLKTLAFSLQQAQAPASRHYIEKASLVDMVLPMETERTTRDLPLWGNLTAAHMRGGALSRPVPMAGTATCGGFHHSNGVMNMQTITYNANDYASALAKLAEKDNALNGAQTRFALLAGAAFLSGEKTFADLVEDACNQTGSRGRPTKELPKGKANPNALKTNGYSGIARVVGTFKKVADNGDNDAVLQALRGFIGFIPNKETYEAAREADERMTAALESGDEAKLAAAEKRFHNGFVNALYTDDNGAVVRPDSFAALEKAVNKAIADAKPKANNVTVEGDGDEGELSPLATATSALTLAEKLSLAEMAIMGATVAELAEAEKALDTLFAAMKAATLQLSEAEEEQRKAA